jgi:hypothetical protein
MAYRISFMEESQIQNCRQLIPDSRRHSCMTASITNCRVVKVFLNATFSWLRKKFVYTTWYGNDFPHKTYAISTNALNALLAVVGATNVSHAVFSFVLCVCVCVCVVLECKLKASHLLNMQSTTWATSLALFAVVSFPHQTPHICLG